MFAANELELELELEGTYLYHRTGIEEGKGREERFPIAKPQDIMFAKCREIFGGSSRPGVTTKGR